MKSFLRNDFAWVPGEETITAIPDHSVPIGQTDKMSKIDIERINKLYKCSEYKRHGRDNPLFPKMYNEMCFSSLMYFFIGRYFYRNRCRRCYFRMSNHSNDSFPILLFRHLTEHEERLTCEKLHDKMSNQLI